VAYFTDWLGVAGGQSVRVSVFHQIADTRRWDIGTYVALDYVTHKTAQYYYGVRPEEATSTRPSYDPRNAFDALVGVSGAYKLNSRYAVMFSTSVNVLGTGAASSPIVEKRNGMITYLGLALTY
jgi:outer membrane protein